MYACLVLLVALCVIYVMSAVALNNSNNLGTIAACGFGSVAPMWIHVCLYPSALVLGCLLLTCVKRCFREYEYMLMQRSAALILLTIIAIGGSLAFVFGRSMDAGCVEVLRNNSYIPGTPVLVTLGYTLGVVDALVAALLIAFLIYSFRVHGLTGTKIIADC